MIQLLLPIIYLAFISLGLPDSILGSVWPFMYTEFNVPVSMAGIISMIIAGGTIVSSLNSHRLNTRLGTGLITLASVATTAIALFGFSLSHSFISLCLWAVPYGLGAGSVDASLNNYVALHYKSRHMNWLHCMWGVGASLGPYIMGMTLAGGNTWNTGYRTISIMQAVLSLILFISLPLWKRQAPVKAANPSSSEPDAAPGETEPEKISLSLPDIFKLRGAREILFCFLCYCGIEQTAGLWASTYLNLQRGIPGETAAGYASLFFIGITVGRGLSGFISFKLNDIQLIRTGYSVILLGIITIFIPGSPHLTLAGLIITGLGCAPIFPGIIHNTPNYFGKDKSQAIIGTQMAFSYIGILGLPPLFGILANFLSLTIFPIYLLILLGIMVVTFERHISLKG